MIQRDGMVRTVQLQEKERGRERDGMERTEEGKEEKQGGDSKTPLDLPKLRDQGGDKQLWKLRITKELVGEGE